MANAITFFKIIYKYTGFITNLYNACPFLYTRTNEKEQYLPHSHTNAVRYVAKAVYFKLVTCKIICLLLVKVTRLVWKDQKLQADLYLCCSPFAYILISQIMHIQLTDKHFDTFDQNSL